jgi:hypothetical protein
LILHAPLALIFGLFVMSVATIVTAGGPVETRDLGAMSLASALR